MRSDRNRSKPFRWWLLAVAALTACAPPVQPLPPPEQASGSAIDTRTSIQGAGVVLPNKGRIRGVLLAPVPGVIRRELAPAQQDATALPLALRGAWQPGMIEPGTGTVAGATVEALDITGQPVAEAVKTDGEGGFAIGDLKPSGPLLVLRTRLQREGCQVTLLNLVPAPRPVGFVSVTVSPATTLVARKAQRAIRERLLSPLLLQTALTDRFAATFAGVLSDRSLTGAACLAEERVAELFDAAFAALPGDVQASLRLAATQLDAAALLAPTRRASGGAFPSPAPSEPPEPFVPEPQASGGLPVTPPAGDPPASGTIPTPPPASASGPRGTLSSLGTALSAARLELDPDGDELYAPWSEGAEGGRLFSLDEPLALWDLERTITAVAFEGQVRYELSGDVLVWDDFAVPISGMGAITYADLAVHDGWAYLLGVEPHNIVQMRLATGETSVLAGPSEAGSGGYRDGPGEEALFRAPTGIVAAPEGLYVADAGNHCVRRVTYDGVVSTFAGGEPGHADGLGGLARFRRPTDLTRDAQGHLYVADSEAHCLRRITQAGLVRTLTGTTRGEVDGENGAGQLDAPVAITWGRLAGEQVLVIGQANNKLRLLRGW
ncbi:MAG: hypothetical protein VKS61_17180 [Candidatus Sericytochromatia bacterium]|nr:hypothetical protein [Candidatus Sericytochromatia bacterium]